MALIGYARVSTAEQNLDLQLDALAAAGCCAVYQEHASGKSSRADDRPELDHCLKALRPGDVLIVWKLDRLGRSLRDLISLVGQLEAQGVGFRSLTESLDATGPGGRLVLHIFASLAEFERELIRSRTRAGLASARARGRSGGRPRALSPADAKAAVSLLGQPDIPVSSICERFRVSRSTLYEYARAAAQPNSN